jgi:hypothetical protein
VLQRRIQEDMHAVSSGMYRLAQQFRAELDDYLDDNLDSNPSFVRKYSILLVVYNLLSGGVSVRKPTFRSSTPMIVF